MSRKVFVSRLALMAISLFEILHFPLATSSADAATKKSTLSTVAKKCRALRDNGSVMPTVFSQREDSYDTYAACLAATEGLRRLRETEMQESKKQLSGKALAMSENKILKKYTRSSGRVINALGMSVKEFNEVAKAVSENADLKKKVQDQAYLYRMAATVHMDRVPLEDKRTLMSRRVKVREKKVQTFAKSLREIERLRRAHVQKLTQALKVKALPSGVDMTDPQLLPFLHPHVRALIKAFPLQAEKIVSKYGLGVNEFNDILETSKTDNKLRWKIANYTKPGTQVAAKKTTMPKPESVDQ